MSKWRTPEEAELAPNYKYYFQYYVVKEDLIMGQGVFERSANESEEIKVFISETKTLCLSFLNFIVNPWKPRMVYMD